MPPILNAQGISKSFGADPLLRDINFTIEERARIGLIGPNGSGKSTLLGILAGEIEPDSGEVATRKRTRLSYVAQQSEFAPGTTVRAVLEASLTRIAAPAAKPWGGQALQTSPRMHLAFRAAGANAWQLPRPWCSSPMCCCWTSQRIIWI